MTGRPRAPTGEPQLEKARAAYRKYYETHKAERLLKMALVTPKEEDKERRRAAYHRKMDERDAARGVPRRMGRPPTTRRQRLEAVVARAEQGGFPQIAEAARAELSELGNKAQNTQ